jgi:hypothetical protein
MRTLSWSAAFATLFRVLDGRSSDSPVVPRKALRFHRHSWRIARNGKDSASERRSKRRRAIGTGANARPGGRSSARLSLYKAPNLNLIHVKVGR